MDDEATALPFPPNLDYGTGQTRRTIALAGDGMTVSARLSDNFHQMAITLRHDGNAITAIEGEMERFPTTACPGARGPLQSLVGQPIAMPLLDRYHGGVAGGHCTHLFDLAALAAAHGCHTAGQRTYEAIVPDDAKPQRPAILRRDGAVILEWRIERGAIESPPELSGKPIGIGFSRWARETFEGDDLEAALVLERTWLISRGRRYDSEQFAGLPASLNRAMAGNCFAYQPGRAETHAFRSGYSRHDLGTISSRNGA